MITNIMIKDAYVYGTWSKTRRFLSKLSHSVTGPKKVYEYLTKKIPSKPVGCMMIVWNEQKTIQATIES